MDPLLGDAGDGEGALLDGQQQQQQHDGDPPLRAYPTRWWILGQYAFFTMMQCTTWAIPGTLADTYLAVYAPVMTMDTIQLFLNYGAFLFCVVAPAVGFWLDKPGGLRQQVLIAASMVTVGCILRCAARDASPGSIAMLHISFVLTALAGPAAMSAVSKLSEEWFPVRERTTATAVATVFNGMGSAVTSLIGPSMVQANTMASLQGFNYLVLGLCALNLACVWAYYPHAPPTPPSASAVVSARAGEKLAWRDLAGVLWRVAKNRQVLVVAAVYGIGGGMQAGWGGLVNSNLNTIGISQYDAGMMGFTSAFIGNIAGIVVGAFADRFRRFKAICVVGAVVGGAATVWVVAALEGWLPPSWMDPASIRVQMYVALTLTYATVMQYPLLFELAIEATHPLPEASVISVLTWVYNFGAALMLAVPLQSAGSAFNYSYMGVQLFMVGLLAFALREDFGRFAFDTGGDGKHAAARDDDPEGAAGRKEEGDLPLL